MKKKLISKQQFKTERVKKEDRQLNLLIVSKFLFIASHTINNGQNKNKLTKHNNEKLEEFAKKFADFERGMKLKPE